MSTADEELSEMLFTLRDAYSIREARLAGDPDRDPDETTVEDVTEAMLKRDATVAEIEAHRDLWTLAFRGIIKAVDQQG